MAKFAQFTKLVSEYEDVADFVTVYIREAHAVDEWSYNKIKFNVKQHTSLEERFDAARIMYERGVQGEYLVDDFNDNARFSYEAFPERLYVILNGVVVMQGGKGPQNYRVEEAEEWLKKYKRSKKHTK